MPDATNGQGPASADEFDRELRELTEGTAGEPLFIEPSAAERAKSATVRVRQPSRRRGRLAGVLFAVAILVAAAVLAWLEYAHSPSSAGTAPPAKSAAAPSAAPQLMGTISPINPFDLPPADPFRGTTADHWADGAAGIVAPAAKPVGTFTAAQVAAAYQTTRKLLIAANLDKPALLGGAPTAFARLLTAKQRATFIADLDKAGVNKAGYPLSSRRLIASFAPGSTELVGNVIKVSGTMSARSVVESGAAVLSIKVNYLFAYAVQPPHDPTDWTRVVDHEYGSVDFARWDDTRGALEPWDRAIVDNADVQCGDAFIHPDYPSDRSIDTRRAAPIISLYSPATGTRGGGTVCGQAAGS